MSHDEIDTREFYTQPATMTSVGDQAPLVKALPADPGVLAEVLHGLVIHEHMTGGYGVTLADADRWTVHVRPAADLLAEIVARDPRPLDVARSPEGRLPGNCRHFTVLEAAMLRAHGTPARARCGFGGYFGTGWFEDHWVCEYWDSGQQRWRLIDAQIDDVQQGWFHTEFDADRRAQGPVPGRRGGVAPVPQRARPTRRSSGSASCRRPATGGSPATSCATARPCSTSSCCPGTAGARCRRRTDPIGDDLAALFDRLAELTLAPDDNLAELRRLYEDERLRVPATVRNAVRGRQEPLWLDGQGRSGRAARRSRSA